MGRGQSQGEIGQRKHIYRYVDRELFSNFDLPGPLNVANYGLQLGFTLFDCAFHQELMDSLDVGIEQVVDT